MQRVVMRGGVCRLRGRRRGSTSGGKVGVGMGQLLSIV